jgi:hypothetical protein
MNQRTCPACHYHIEPVISMARYGVTDFSQVLVTDVSAACTCEERGRMDDFDGTLVVRPLISVKSVAALVLAWSATAAMVVIAMTFLI